MKRMGFTVIPIAVVLIACVLIFAFFPENKKEELKFEFVKYLIQLSLIVIFGGILIQEYNRRRDKIKAMNDFRKTLLVSMSRAYFNTKRARRILRANIIPDQITKSRGISYSVYVEQIKVVNEAQLEFEFYMDQLETYPHVFSSENTVALIRMASGMEVCLNNLVKEYEKLKVPFDSSKVISASRLPELSAFVEKEPYNASFSNLFHASAELIQKELLQI